MGAVRSLPSGWSDEEEAGDVAERDAAPGITLIDRLGDEAAATLMEHLPPGGWENIATKDDLKLVEERLTVKIDRLDGKIDSGLTGLRGEIDGLDAKIDGKIDGLDAKIDSSITGLRGEILLAMARQTRTIVFTIVGIAITIWLALLLPIGAG